MKEPSLELLRRQFKEQQARAEYYKAYCDRPCMCFDEDVIIENCKVIIPKPDIQQKIIGGDGITIDPMYCKWCGGLLPVDDWEAAQ